MFAHILSVLDKGHLRLNIVERDVVGAQERVTFTVLASRARHKELLAELNASDATEKVVAFRDEQED